MGTSGEAVVESISVGDGGVKIGASGISILEIVEITGTVNGGGYGDRIIDALPVGWTGQSTRVLSLEIQRGGSQGEWGSLGTRDYGPPTTNWVESVFLEHNGRDILLYYPWNSDYVDANWRMVIMKVN